MPLLILVAAVPQGTHSVTHVKYLALLVQPVVPRVEWGDGAVEPGGGGGAGHSLGIACQVPGPLGAARGALCSVGG